MAQSVDTKVSSRFHMMGEIIASRVDGMHDAPFGTWRFDLPGTRREAVAQLAEHWLSVDSALGSLREFSLQRIRRYLRRNPAMPDGARIVCANDMQQTRYVLDIPAEGLPWANRAELARIVSGAVDTVRAATKAKSAPVDKPSGADLAADDVEQLFVEAKWPLQAGNDVSACVPLDVPGHYIVADVAAEAAVIRLTVPVLATEFPAAPQVCRDAITALVWFTASSTRMVRPDLQATGLSFTTATNAGPTAVGHACAALSVALQRFIPEAGYLVADEDLALTYLSVIGLECGSVRSSRGRSSTVRG